MLIHQVNIEHFAAGGFLLKPRAQALGGQGIPRRVVAGRPLGIKGAQQRLKHKALMIKQALKPARQHIKSRPVFRKLPQPAGGSQRNADDRTVQAPGQVQPGLPAQFTRQEHRAVHSPHLPLSFLQKIVACRPGIRKRGAFTPPSHP